MTERERLAAAIRSAEAEASSPPPLPSPEQTWDALRGELISAEAESVIERVVRSPSGFEELALARAIEEELAEVCAKAPVASLDAVRTSRRGTKVGVIAAVVAAAAAILIIVRPDPSPPPPAGFRGGEEALEPITAHGASMATDDFVLRWKAGPAGSTYSVRASTSEGRLLVQRRGLSEPELRIELPILADLGSGTEVLWQFEVELPDGRRARSSTFTVVLE